MSGSEFLDSIYNCHFPTQRLSLTLRDSILQATTINNKKEAHRLDETTVLFYTMDLSTGRIWCLCGPETSSQKILQMVVSRHYSYISKPHGERLKMTMVLRNRGSLCVCLASLKRTQEEP